MPYSHLGLPHGGKGTVALHTGLSDRDAHPQDRVHQHHRPERQPLRRVGVKTGQKRSIFRGQGKKCGIYYVNVG